MTVTAPDGRPTHPRAGMGGSDLHPRNSIQASEGQQRISRRTSNNHETTFL